jgi:hypothetical protein
VKQEEAVPHSSCLCHLHLSRSDDVFATQRFHYEFSFMGWHGVSTNYTNYSRTHGSVFILSLRCLHQPSSKLYTQASTWDSSLLINKIPCIISQDLKIETQEDMVKLRTKYKLNCRSQWPRGLRHKLSSPAQTPGSWVRIPLKAWMSVCVYSVYAVLCAGNCIATGWSPVQGL